MATGRMQYLSEALNRITEFSFVINNDAREEDRNGNLYYDRPAKNLYLLHGLTGIDTDWIWGGGNAHQLSRRYHLNIFMPTCGNNFYLDRPGTGNAYGTFAGKEFVDYTRSVFGLSGRREDTYIGGLSMGGFGAMQMAFSHPETFAGAIALSSPNPVETVPPSGWDTDLPRYDAAFLREVFGEAEGAAASVKNPKMRAARVLEAGGVLPRLYLACGTEDTLIDVNRSYRDYFRFRIPNFRYEEGPGIHDWEFWREYIARGLEWVLKQ